MGGVLQPDAPALTLNCASQARAGEAMKEVVGVRPLQKKGTFIWEFPEIWGSLIKDPTIYGTILGSLIFGSSLRHR